MPGRLLEPAWALVSFPDFSVALHHPALHPATDCSPCSIPSVSNPRSGQTHHNEALDQHPDGSAP